MMPGRRILFATTLGRMRRPLDAYSRTVAFIIVAAHARTTGSRE
jgi:hypothetical protein